MPVKPLSSRSREKGVQTRRAVLLFYYCIINHCKSYQLRASTVLFISWFCSLNSSWKSCGCHVPSATWWLMGVTWETGTSGPPSLFRWSWCLSCPCGLSSRVGGLLTWQLSASKKYIFQEGGNRSSSGLLNAWTQRLRTLFPPHSVVNQSQATAYIQEVGTRDLSRAALGPLQSLDG